MCLVLSIIYFWLHWVFVAVRASFLVMANGGYSLAVVWASHCVAALVAEHGL